MQQVGNLDEFNVWPATGRAYTMLRKNEWCYSETLQFHKMKQNWHVRSDEQDDF